MPGLPIIDVHTHAVGLAGGPLTQASDPEASTASWKIAETLAMMERHGIGESILSPVPFSFDGLSAAEAKSHVRRVNEELASLVAQDSRRLGGFGLLPMPDPEGALEEAAYLLDDLQLDGVCMATNANGIYPGDDRYQALFDYLDSRAAVVFIHPAVPLTYEHATLGIDPATLEFMFDSTRAVTSLVYSGTVRNHPRLKIITCHGGGTIPYIASRIATHATTRNAGRIPATTADDVLRDLRSLYYDITAAMNPMALAALVEFVPRSHLLTGFDYPIRPERLYEADLQALAACPGLSSEDLAAIRRTNALALFPRFGASA